MHKQLSASCPTEAPLPGEMRKMGVSVRGGPLGVWPKSCWSITPWPFTGWPGTPGDTLEATESLSMNSRSTRQSPGSRAWTRTQVLQQLSYSLHSPTTFYSARAPYTLSAP